MPYLVFLHGLLGTKVDWENVIKNLPHFSCIALDLPFHGENKRCEVENFDQVNEFLSRQILNKVGNHPYFLVGYSLGGRIALTYAFQNKSEKGNLQGLILEGANLGLTNEPERRQRWQNDCYWARRFATESPRSVLDDWYQQAVFSHLDTSQKQELIQLRQANCGENITKMLKATSLALQPDFRDQVQSSALPIFYFCGEQDLKFINMAKESKLNLHLIPHAGHNAHQENPKGFSIMLEKLLS